MLVNILFPFDDELLRGYERKVFSKNDLNNLFLPALIIIIVSLAFSIIGTSSSYQKLILASPAIIECVCGIAIINKSNNEKLIFFGLLLIVYSISSFFMGVTIHYYITEIDSSSIWYLFISFASAYLILLPIGYRIYYCRLKKYGEEIGNANWNKIYTAIAVVLGIAIAKALTAHAIFYLLLILWIFLHLLLSVFIVLYRKFCRSIDVEQTH